MMKLGIAALVAFVFAACSNSGRQTDAGTAMRRVENNSGEILGAANRGIQRGVDSADKAWETPRERQRENQHEEAVRRDRELNP